MLVSYHTVSRQSLNQDTVTIVKENIIQSDPGIRKTWTRTSLAARAPSGLGRACCIAAGLWSACQHVWHPAAAGKGASTAASSTTPYRWNITWALLHLLLWGSFKHMQIHFCSHGHPSRFNLIYWSDIMCFHFPCFKFSNLWTSASIVCCYFSQNEAVLNSSYFTRTCFNKLEQTDFSLSNRNIKFMIESEFLSDHRISPAAVWSGKHDDENTNSCSDSVLEASWQLWREQIDSSLSSLAVFSPVLISCCPLPRHSLWCFCINELVLARPLERRLIVRGSLYFYFSFCNSLPRSRKCGPRRAESRRPYPNHLW